MLRSATRPTTCAPTSAHRRHPLVLAVTLAFATPLAAAATKTWNCTDGKWETASCWSPSGIPASSDDANVYPVGSANTTLRFDSTTGTRSIDSLVVNSTSSYTLTLQQSGGSLTSAWYTVGPTGTGRVTQSEGTASTPVFYLGYSASGSGTYSLQGGSLTLTGSSYGQIGYYGEGSFSQSGGVLTAGNGTYGGVAIGTYSGSNGSFSLSGTGQVSATYLWVGSAGNASFTQSGSSSAVDAVNLRMGAAGQGSGETSAYTLYSGTLASTVSSVGYEGQASFAQSGGTHTATTLQVGYRGKGSYALGSGTLNTSSSYIGYYDAGSFSQAGGTHDTDTLILGSMAGSSGSYNLSGGTLSVGSLVRGSGSSSFSWTRGAIILGTTLNVTESGFFGDSLNVGAGKTLTTTSYVNVAADGRLNQTGGGSVSAPRLLNHGQYLLEGSTLTLTGTSASENYGTLTFSGGVTAGANPIINYGTVAGNGTIGGSGGLTNRMTLRASSGQLGLTNTGSNQNFGTIELPAGGRLAVTSNLINHGVISLAGGTLASSGSGAIANEADGMLVGQGTASGAFGPNKGVIIARGGMLSFSNALSNSGQIVLDGLGTGITGGGAITNSGSVQGAGYIANTLANTGTVEAVGGTLTLASTSNTHAGAGVITIGPGAKVLMSGGLATNAALIQLAGGSFDNGGKLLANAAAGRIVGAGTWRAGSTTNSGQIAFSFGLSHVAGAIDNLAAGKVIVSNGAQVTFADALVNRGELRISAGGAGNFFGLVSGTGQFNGDGEARFEGGFWPGASPAVVTVSFETIHGAGSPILMELSGTTPGNCDSCADKIIFSNAVTLQGGPLNVVWRGSHRGRAGDTYDLFDWGGDVVGTFGQLDLPALDAGLVWRTAALYTSGEIGVAAVPEPET